METYDLLMLAVLGGATIFGFWKGLAWQVASLASLVVSYFAALKFADRLAPMISDDAPSNKFIAMLVIYAGSSMAIWMIFRVVAGAIDRIKLNEFDRQMGAMVGFAKGVLLCIAITFFAVTLAGDQQRDKIVASRSGQYIVQVLDKADKVVPPQLHEYIGEYIHTVNERLDPDYVPAHNPATPDIQQLWQNAKQGAGEAINAANAANAAASNPNLNWLPSAAGQLQPFQQQPPTATPQTPAQPISTGGGRL
jgi:membrane protein required for colicin V production